MTERFSNEINQGLCIKQALREKIENITTALVKRLELHLQSEATTRKGFSSFKGVASHFIEAGWSGTSKAIFIFNDGWALELTSGMHAYLKNEKLNFLMGSGEYQGGNIHYPPEVKSYPSSVAELYKLDSTLDLLLLDIYNRITPLQSWFNDLQVRGLKEDF